MDRASFDAYVAAFNRRDYDRVLDFWADAFTVEFAGYTFRGPAEFLGFYRFFHAHAAETIEIEHFLSSAERVMIEVVVRLEGLDDLTPQILADAGYDRLVSLRRGEVIRIPQFIHYSLRDSKFTSVICCISGPPVTESAGSGQRS